MFEELIEKVSHVFARYYRSEKAKNPLACVYISSKVESFEFVMKFWQIRLYQHFNHETMLKETGELWPINISHVALLDQRDEEPEGENF